MPREPHVDALMKKLLRAIEVSLSATDAARDAVQEILRARAPTPASSSVAPRAVAIPPSS